MVEKEVQNIRALLQIKSILWDGVSLWKIPFHVLGSAKRRHLRIKRGEDSSLSQKIKVIEKNSEKIEKAFFPLTLEILGEKNKTRQIKLDDIVSIRKDSFSEAFNAFRARHGPTALPHHTLCFSIVTVNRTFDLYAESPTENKIMIGEILNLMSSLSSSAKVRQPPRNRLEVDSLKKKQFFAAAKAGDVAKFQWYLRQDYDIETEESDARKDTALIAACRLGRTNVVQIALEFDAKNDP